MTVNHSAASAPSSRRLALRAVTALFASTALLLAGTLSVAPAANAASTSSITGTLTNAGGTPVAGASVELFQVVNLASSVHLGEVETGINGKYSFTGLESGTYTLGAFDVSGYKSQYLGGSYDRNTATKVKLGNAQAKGANMRLSLGKAISGTVKNAAGSPVAGLNVGAYQWVTDDGSPYWSWASSGATTGPDGKYTLPNLLAGKWAVTVYGSSVYADAYYGGVYDLEDATPIAVTAAAGKTGANLSLTKGGTVTGVVKTPTGANFGSGWVTAVRLYTDAWGVQQYEWDNEDSPHASDGKYTVSALRPGTYTLAFYSWDDAFPWQVLGGVDGITGGTRFTVKSGATTTINTKLRTKLYVGPSTTKVTLSKANPAYGTASTATVAVTGKGAAATGTVKLTVGSKTIATKTVVAGKAKFALPANLAIGKHAVRATYATTGQLQSSTSPAAMLTVTKIATKVTAKANKKASKLSIKVSATGHVPTGSYVVKAGKTTVAKGKLAKGKASVKLKSLGSGKHKLKVTYQGSSKFSGSSTKVTVKR